MDARIVLRSRALQKLEEAEERYRQSKAKYNQ
jgi:hypothetical protein